MASIIQDVVNYHNYIFYEYEGINQDVLKYPLMGSALPMVGIIVCYFYFCKYSGPRLMKNRPPYSPQKAMLVYNVFQVVANLYLFLMGIYEFTRGSKEGFNLLCFVKDEYNHKDIDIEFHTEKYNLITYYSYLYLLMKIVDLFDTVFMVLRKNSHQISVLHLYHHATMPLMVYYLVKYKQDAQCLHSAYANIFVHIFVYGYYLLTSYAPEFKNNIRMKKSITILQMCQFIFVLTMIFIVRAQEHCPVSAILSYVLGFQAVMFFFMFLNFYYKTYIVRGKKIA